MGIKTKKAKGPNPLSIKKKKTALDVGREDSPGDISKKKRRLRKGKRSRELSFLKKRAIEQQTNMQLDDQEDKAIII